jgi:hypothetical protein
MVCPGVQAPPLEDDVDEELEEDDDVVEDDEDDDDVVAPAPPVPGLVSGEPPAQAPSRARAGATAPRGRARWEGRLIARTSPRRRRGSG